MHSYGITLHIQTVSKNLLRVEEGSLYPALHRMEQEGWIRAEWGTSETNRRARYYRLTPVGRRRLREEEKNWELLIHAVDRVLQFTGVSNVVVFSPAPPVANGQIGKRSG